MSEINWRFFPIVIFVFISTACADLFLVSYLVYQLVTKKYTTSSLVIAITITSAVTSYFVCLIHLAIVKKGSLIYEEESRSKSNSGPYEDTALLF